MCPQSSALDEPVMEILNMLFFGQLSIHIEITNIFTTCHVTQCTKKKKNKGWSAVKSCSKKFSFTVLSLQG